MFVKGTSDEEEALREEEERQRKLKDIVGKTDLSLVKKTLSNFSANIYLFKVNNRNSRKKCEICSKALMTSFKFVCR